MNNLPIVKRKNKRGVTLSNTRKKSVIKDKNKLNSYLKDHMKRVNVGI